jgi:hypothetical protein
MRKMTEMVLDGILCESCGEYIGSAVGYSRRCESCGGGEDEVPNQDDPFEDDDLDDEDRSAVGE